MDYAVALKPVIPLRALASESSEMISQILWGETFQILQTQEKWLEVITTIDCYTGWIDRKMAQIIPQDEFDMIGAAPLSLIGVPVADIKASDSRFPIRVSIGCSLPGYDASTRSLKLAGRKFQVLSKFVTFPSAARARQLLRTAEYFINTPYLWGGRNIMGIDCSGFTQTVFRLNGIMLPRDASQQILLGDEVCFEERVPGDLAFFSNDKGRIIHVGIVYTPDTIIHASGDVHIDILRKEGIWSDSRQVYTHSAPLLRRIPQLLRR